MRVAGEFNYWDAFAGFFRRRFVPEAGVGARYKVRDPAPGGNWFQKADLLGRRHRDSRPRTVITDYFHE